MGGLIGFVGLLMLLAGIISLVKPLRFLRIPTRKMAGLVSSVGLVLILAGSAIAGPVDELDEADSPVTQPEAAAPTTTTEATTTTETTTTEATATTTETLTLPEYEIYEIRDVSFAGAVRYDVHVVVEPNVRVDQLEAIARNIAEDMRSSRQDYQALSIGFYDYQEYIGFGYVLGNWEHVPFGDWGRAADVALGDYSQFQEVSNLREKDWSKRPTGEQVSIWRQWEEELLALEEEEEYDPDRDYEDEAYELVAQRLGITKQAVIDAVEAAAFWPFQGS